MATLTTLAIHPTFAPALPSATSALALVNGEKGALPLVIAHTTLRAGLIAIGLGVANLLEPEARLRRRRILPTALIASLSIEAFVLTWAAYQKSQVPG